MTPTPNVSIPVPVTVPSFVVNPSVDLVAVYVTSPFQIGGYQINPWYCASLSATQRLVSYFKSKLGLIASISFDWPEGSFAGGSPFQQSGMVPYVDFPDVTNGNGHMNAGGTLLEYYVFPNTSADQTLKEWLGM